MKQDGFTNVIVVSVVAYLGFTLIKKLVQADIIGVTDTEGNRIALAAKKNGEIRDQYGNLWT